MNDYELRTAEGTCVQLLCSTCKTAFKPLRMELGWVLCACPTCGAEASIRAKLQVAVVIAGGPLTLQTISGAVVTLK